VITYEIPRLSLSWPHCCRYYWRQCRLKKHNNIFLGKITMKNCPDWKNMQKLLNWQSHSLSHSVVYTDSLKQNSLYYSSMVECPPLQFSKFDQMWLSTDEVIKLFYFWWKWTNETGQICNIVSQAKPLPGILTWTIYHLIGLHWLPDVMSFIGMIFNPYQGVEKLLQLRQLPAAPRYVLLRWLHREKGCSV
jgi:hypothetical protein